MCTLTYYGGFDRTHFRTRTVSKRKNKTLKLQENDDKPYWEMYKITHTLQK